jgi:hypothetical protein
MNKSETKPEYMSELIDIGHIKKYFKIDQDLARHFEYYGASLYSPPPAFYAVK